MSELRVPVINKHGEALMPCKPRKARLLLKEGKARVISRAPFAIQLIYGSAGYKQKLVLGVDTGHTSVGVSVNSKEREVFSAEATLRNDISKGITNKRMYRRNRRSRLRYRAKRFLNRSASKRLGRLPPSVQWKVDTHIKLIHKICSLFPISKIIIETAKFDNHKLKDPTVKGKGYQKGERYGYGNTKAYVLERDHHTCQVGDKGCSNVLHVHHIKYKSNGGTDVMSNLVTVCEKHHKQIHSNRIKPDFKKHASINNRAATTMSIIRKRILEAFPDAVETFGYVTKARRLKLGLEKSHTNDAFVIASGKHQERTVVREIKFRRKNDRCLQLNMKGRGIQVRKNIYAIRPGDVVEYEGKRFMACRNDCGKRGKPRLCMTDGGKVFSRNIGQVKVVYHQKGMIFNLGEE